MFRFFITREVHFNWSLLFKIFIHEVWIVIFLPLCFADIFLIFMLLGTLLGNVLELSTSGFFNSCTVVKRAMLKSKKARIYFHFTEKTFIVSKFLCMWNIFFAATLVELRFTLYAILVLQAYYENKIEVYNYFFIIIMICVSGCMEWKICSSPLQPRSILSLKWSQQIKFNSYCFLTCYCVYPFISNILVIHGYSWHKVIVK